MPRERLLMGEMLHKIKTLIESGKFPFSDAKQEVPVGRKSADIVLYDNEGKAALVIELKQPDGSLIHDPYYPDVVEQAANYANGLGVNYFITTNTKHFVLWKTFQEGTPLLDRQLLHYDATTPIDRTINQILTDLELLKQGKIKFLSIDEKFIKRLKTFYDILWPTMLTGLDNLLKKDRLFKKKYTEWLFEQEFILDEETNEKIVKQYAHLISNRIFFYKLLEGNFSSLPKLNKIDTDNETKFKEELNKHFNKALEIDYEAVFSSTFFDQIPLSKESITLFNQFISELEQYKLADIEYDIIGKVFESLIPMQERHYLGQYYTRADVVDLIENLTIKTADDVIFDPACGSGTFLVRAYYNLLNKDKSKKHKELLSQIYGTDINQFAAHLSVINLTIRNLTQLTNKVNILVNDFFNLRPRLQVLLPFSGKDIRGKERSINIPKFDVIVANPPYTRQEELGEYAKEYKSKLQSVIKEDWDSRYNIGKRASIYSYFIMHAPKFMKPNGRLGFIVSNSWMDADYGKEIQKMLLQNFKIKAIIESNVERWFDDAGINTSIIIAEQENDIEKRDKNDVKFVLLKKKLQEYDDLKKIANEIEEIKEFTENDKLRVFVINQKELYNEGIYISENGKKEWLGAKWRRFLRAPSVYFKIMQQKDKFKFLEEQGELKYGIKTGATKFFVLDKRSAKKFGIEARFLNPILHSTKELKRTILKESDVKNVLFNSNLDKIEMRGTKALSYINMGEIKGINKITSVKGRKRWYDAGLQDAPKIIIPIFYGKRHFAVYNKEKIQIENTFFGITPNENVSDIAFAAYLNSSLFALTKELYGRVNLGEGVLTIYGPDWKNMPVLNLSILTKEQREKLEKIFLKLSKREILPIDKEIDLKDHRDLDDIIFDVFNLSKAERQEIYSTLKQLVKERTIKGSSVKRNGNSIRKNKKKNENLTNNSEQGSLLFLV